MRKFMPILLALACVAALLFSVVAQQPGGKDYSNSSIVVKMMAFNKKKDGKLTKKEVTDPRLHRLFDMADTNKDGIVTREELMALAAKLDAEFGPGDKGFGKDKGPPDGKGPFGKGPKGPPRPGQILPPFLQEMLNLTPEQKKQLDDLQKEVDAKLGKILTDDQKKQLQDFVPKKGPKGKGPDGKGPDGKEPPDKKGPPDKKEPPDSKGKDGFEPDEPWSLLPQRSPDLAVLLLRSRGKETLVS